MCTYAFEITYSDLSTAGLSYIILTDKQSARFMTVLQNSA